MEGGSPLSNRTLTPIQAAELLGVTADRVRKMIHAGRLTATPFGRGWAIKEADLAKVRDRKPGRPKTKR